MDDVPNCGGCHKPEPADYCWENRGFECPAGKPPRWAFESEGVYRLWEQIRGMRGH